MRIDKNNWYRYSGNFCNKINNNNNNNNNNYNKINNNNNNDRKDDNNNNNSNYNRYRIYCLLKPRIMMSVINLDG